MNLWEVPPLIAAAAERRLTLGPLEFEVMEVVWTVGASNVRDVATRMQRSLAYTTVMTTLDRLYKKGLLEREMSDRAFIYSTEIVARRLGPSAGGRNDGQASWPGRWNPATCCCRAWWMRWAHTTSCCSMNSREKCNGNAKNWLKQTRNDSSVLSSIAVPVPRHVFRGACAGVGGGSEHLRQWPCA